MLLYAYFDDSAPSGIRAFTAFKKATSARAQQFKRPDRPEILKIDIGNLTHQRAADLLTGENYALEMEDIA